MLRRILFSALLLCGTVLSVAAQQTPLKIRGTALADDSGEPLIGATIIVNPSDSTSSFVGRTTLTDVKGNFVITSSLAAIELGVEYLGYATLLQPVVRPKSGARELHLGSLKLSPKAQQIKQLVVTGESIMSQMRGDTLQYNSAAFKTNPDATTEDLLKKMPGIVTEADGVIKSQGQEIAKVYVNGKEFFDDDPSLALKTLAADAVESIQLYDDMSEDAKFSGFDDGVRVRSINITTKAGVDFSTFGKAYAGYGTNGKYAAGLGLNIFNGDHRFTLIGSGDNVNSEGFTLMDVMGMSSSGRGGSGMGRGRMGNLGADLSNFRTSTRGGVRTTQSLGFNYNGQFKDKLKLSASYFFSARDAANWNNTQRNYLTMPRMTMDSSQVQGYDQSHNLRLKMEWTPDKNNVITFTPRIRYSTNNGYSIASNEITLEDILNNSSKNRYSTSLWNINSSANLWWTRRLGKAGRTISLGGVVSGTKASGDRYQLSFNPMLPTAQDTTVNLKGRVNTSSYSLSGSVTYSEPLSKSSRLSVNYLVRYDRSFSDQNGLEWDKLQQDYALLDTATTNYLSRNYTTHTAGLAYNYVFGKVLNLTANINYQLATLNQDQTLYQATHPEGPMHISMRRPFYAVLPGLNLAFTPKRTEKLTQSLNLQYNTTPIFPSVTQLQDVLDISNPLSVSKGNPDLEQGYSNYVGLRYNLANMKNSSNFNIMAMYVNSSNYIANHRQFVASDTIINGSQLASGTQYTTPVNLDGYNNFNVYTTYSFRIKPLRSNLSVSAMYMFSQNPSMENNVVYKTTNNSIGGTLSLTSNISERVDFTLSYRPAVSFARSSARSFDRYQTHDAIAQINVFLVGGLYINADATWRNNFGTQASYSQHYALVNGAIGYKFMKFKQADIKLSVYDALGQNRSMSQSITDTYSQITTTNILSRYFMVSFTYKFDTRKGRSAANYGKGESSNSRSGSNMPRPAMGGGGYRH